jgi:hypothetical protein
MALWSEWWAVVSELRSACTRSRTFLWMAVTLAGLCIREDLAGVTSVVRVFGLRAHLYDRLLDFFHTGALDPDRLSRRWTAVVLRMFPDLLRVGGRLVLLADGIKVPKAGRKMPAVKRLKQVESNTKPEFIFGHSCQAISVVAAASSSAFAVPLAARIHEGLVFSNRDQRAQPRKLVLLLEDLGIGEKVTLVADAYYACETIGRGLLASGSHLVSRVRNNAVAFREPRPRGKAGPGRPQKYGGKVRLRVVLEGQGHWKWHEAESPVYGERGVKLRYRVADLIWRPLGRKVRFVAVHHPIRGKAILLCTDLAMDPVEIIRLYGIRFKIELSFKQALRVLGTYTYHFWMRTMKPLSHRGRTPAGDRHLHRESDDYRDAVRRKMAAYHRHIQLGLVAQGLLQYLAVRAPAVVWSSFGSWLRTIRPGIPPSEKVTAMALRQALPEFLASSAEAHPLANFLRARIDLNRYEGLRLAG